MSWVAASGCDTKETCEAGTSTIVAFARSAMNRWSAGGIALSLVPSRYQHGSVPRQRPRRRARERGYRVRPLRRSYHRGRVRVDVGGERGAERVAVQVEVSALAPVRPGVNGTGLIE